MPTTLRIKVTKEILEKSKYCGQEINKPAYSNCAVALAILQIFPFAGVGTNNIVPFFQIQDTIPCKPEDVIALPEIARSFIRRFDTTNHPFLRANMKPIEFDIEIPDSVIEQINIDELRPLLENHPTLKFVNEKLFS